MLVKVKAIKFKANYFKMKKKYIYTHYRIKLISKSSYLN